MQVLKVKAISAQRLAVSFLWFPMSFGKKFSFGMARFWLYACGDCTRL